MERILFTVLQYGLVLHVFELVDGEWVELLPEEHEAYFKVPYDLWYEASDESETGFAWVSEDEEFMVDAMVDGGEPPAPDTAYTVAQMFFATLAGDDEDDEDEDLTGVSFCFEQPLDEEAE